MKRWDGNSLWLYNHIQSKQARLKRKKALEVKTCPFCNVVRDFSCSEASCSVILSCITYGTYKLPAPWLSLSQRAHEDTPQTSPMGYCTENHFYFDNNFLLLGKYFISFFSQAGDRSPPRSHNRLRTLPTIGCLQSAAAQVPRSHQ